MRLGLFMMPLHHPDRDYQQVLSDDREAIILADQLGYAEAWVGEHFACSTEPIPDPLQFMATLVPVTKQIKFATGVLNLPQHHPAQIAGMCAQFDHLSKGRFVMGVGPGGTGPDFELYKVIDKPRSEMMVESVDIIHKIWAGQAPYSIKGKFWEVVVENSVVHRLGLGPMRTPYQKPYPEVAVSAMSPSSSTAKLAGTMGWSVVSANFMPSNLVKTHWTAYCEGAAAAGRKPDRRSWRVARSIVIGDSDAEVQDYLANDDCSPGWYYGYLRDVLAMHKLLKIFKPDESIPDAALTVQKCLEYMVVSGSAKTVTDKLVAIHDELGGFGTLLITQKDWDNAALHKKSMRLLAEKVMPVLRQHAGTALAAE